MEAIRHCLDGWSNGGETVWPWHRSIYALFRAVCLVSRHHDTHTLPVSAPFVRLSLIAILPILSLSLELLLLPKTI
jgi:hypothetical protein